MLPADIRRPEYDRRAQETGIVHLGIGAFHRAHQAVYTDGAMEAGDRNWAITGVSFRSARVRDFLAPQNGLYSVTARSERDERVQVVGSVRNVVVAPEDPEMVVRLLAAPATSIATLTITEKGYSLDSAEAKADLGNATPSSVFGYLRWGLARRREARLPGLTLLSCDNLTHNGVQLHRRLGEFLDGVDRPLRRWFEAECACPSTMVDRIVPATTGEDLGAVERRLGVEDRGAVITEPFSQWIIEDRFAGRRPRWEAVGATLISDVRVHELAKVRMLNGAHSALAYVGLERGHTFVHEAIADFEIALLVSNMTREAGETLPSDFGVQGYAETLIHRFRNRAVPHRLRQIAIDGSQKIRQRLLPVLAERQREGRSSPATLRALAAWIRHLRGIHGAVEDPLAAELKALWDSSGEHRIVDALFGAKGLFVDSWSADESNRRTLRQLVEAETA